MGLISQFDKRMEQIYESSSQGAPLKFTKVAKSACKQVKREAMRVDGVDTSPNLITILINAADERQIYPYYEQTTTELSYCLTQYARDHKLAVTQDPLVRFMSNDAIKPGTFFCCAQMAPYDIIKQLQHEERALLGKKGKSSARRASVDLNHPLNEHALDDDIILPVLEGVPDLPAPPAPVAVPVTGLSTANNVSLGGKDYQAARYSQTPADFALEEDGSGKRHQLHADSYVLGRDRSVADITFKDSNVSRAHAKLYREDGIFILEDLNSTNGVYVNGTRISSPVELRLDDEIVLGTTTLYLVRG